VRNVVFELAHIRFGQLVVRLEELGDDSLLLSNLIN